MPLAPRPPFPLFQLLHAAVRSPGRGLSVAAAVLGLSILGGACSPTVPPGLDAGTGGSGVTTGGSATVGGSGGGGAAPSGGSGGAVGAGGSAGTGGAGASVGSGGEVATGGSGSGGSGATGGAATGGAESVGGADGAGGAPALVLATPIQKSASSYMLAFGDYVFEVNPQQGARIVTFSLSGTNLLRPLDTESGFLNGGSTFWISPQTWTWPPSTAVDENPYTVSLDGDSIVTLSSSATFEGNALTVGKRFTANLAEEAIDITYTIANAGPGAATHAPWEISRHARGGVTFWPASGVPFGSTDNPPSTDFNLTLASGHYFWVDNGTATGKYSADGAGGWMAHVAGDLLFVKVWTDVPSNLQATSDGAGEVELYLGSGYIEFEIQGPNEPIALDGSKDWNVRWYVRTLPASIDKSAGSTDLIDAVTALLP